MSDLKVRPPKEPHKQKRCAGHPADPRQEHRLKSVLANQDAPFARRSLQNLLTAKIGKVERGGECTYNRATPTLLRGITGTHEGKAMDE